ncbi:MAG: hypothetical protein KME07_02205 [Pegethrix bostrychoides GSE-TBD4-15B]|uniref:Uncharacterized protein n=1 Tax=Pegethrix bostrychoides GSE-TBD4-15B TaxID=2839662 RepID=A0A951P7U9_9CYAN|nr:hypothetical protein [Pegethrix bostrychoides GSE-TBD4-15B]
MSKIIQEVFPELIWNDELEAKAARDRRAVELQAQGYICVYENLFTVAGHRVFLLKASRPEPVEKLASNRRDRSAPRPKRSRPPQAFEER